MHLYRVITASICCGLRADVSVLGIAYICGYPAHVIRFFKSEKAYQIFYVRGLSSLVFSWFYLHKGTVWVLCSAPVGYVDVVFYSVVLRV